MSDHRERWHPLTVTLGAALAVFVALHLLLDAVTEGRGDMAVLAVGLTACLAIVVVMATYTAWHRWTWLGSGLFVLMIGLTALLGYAVAVRVNTEVDPSDMWLEAARSGISVGSVATLYGLWRRRRHARKGGGV